MPAGMDRGSRDSGNAHPQASSQEEWEATTPEQQAEVVQSLPGEVTDEELAMPKGHRHFHPKLAALLQLKDFFQRRRCTVYVASELPVYYPRPAQRFAHWQHLEALSRGQQEALLWHPLSRLPGQGLRPRLLSCAPPCRRLGA